MKRIIKIIQGMAGLLFLFLAFIGVTEGTTSSIASSVVCGILALILLIPAFKKKSASVEPTIPNAAASNVAKTKPIPYSAGERVSTSPPSSDKPSAQAVLPFNYYIELPCLPLEDLARAKNLAAEISDYDLGVEETHICSNEEGQEVSILLGTNMLPMNDDNSLSELREFAQREDLPVVLYSQHSPSYRKGFWPDEEDNWIEQSRDFDFWKEHLEELLRLEEKAH